MANDVMFEGKERRMAKIEKCLAEAGIASLEEAKALCTEKGIDVEAIVKGVQPIAFDNAVWAYTLGVALAIKAGGCYHRQRLAGVLRARFRCGTEKRRSRPRQPRRNAFE